MVIGGSEERVETRERETRRGDGTEELAVGEDLVRLGVDLHHREGVVQLHVGLADVPTLADGVDALVEPQPGAVAFGDGALRYDPRTLGPRVAGGRIAGWASLNRYNPREAYGHTVELSVYVRHERRGHGIGRALMNELMTRARASGHHVVLAQVAADQEPSLRLHRSFGFEDVGRLREVGFKFDRWLDVILLDRILPAAPRRELT